MINILFVDDEPRVLEAIRRSMYGQRHRWSAQFAGSGSAALALLDQQAFDMVISDMRMPEMDGARFLATVRERHPEAIRVILSGEAEFESAVHSMSVAHQFLSKPCDGAALVAFIGASLENSSGGVHDKIRQLSVRMGGLPSAPRVHGLLTRRLADPTFTIEQVAGLIRRDTGLAASVMRLANSAFFGRGGGMTDLDAAVARLGARTIGHLTLSGEVFEIDPAHRARLPLDIEQLQTHSLAVARVAAKLVETGGSCDDAFASGLLHEIGRLVIASRLPEDFRLIEALVVTGGCVRGEAERQVLGFQQGELGAYLFALWGLPSVVVESVRTFSDVGMGPADPVTVARAVAIADDLVEADGSARKEPRTVRFAADARFAAWSDRAHDILAAGDEHEEAA